MTKEHTDTIVDRAQSVDEKAYQASLNRLRNETRGGSDPQGPDELEGYSADEIMAAIDVLAQRPPKEGWLDESVALDPFGIAVAVRIGSYVAVNSALEGMGFTKYDTEEEAIAAMKREVDQSSNDPFAGMEGLEGS